MDDQYIKMNRTALRQEVRDREINKGLNMDSPDALRDVLRADDARLADQIAEQDRADAEYAERQRAKAEAEQAHIAEEERIEREHPMVTGKTPAEPKAARPVADDKPARAQSGSSNGLKIEPNRDTQNGVSRPSVGGKCRAVWDMLDAEGRAVTAKRAREIAAERGFDRTTTMVQFYKWRKFQGIEGRQA